MLCLMNVLHTLLPRAVSWFLIGFNLSQESAIVLMFLMEFSICHRFSFLRCFYVCAIYIFLLDCSMEKMLGKSVWGGAAIETLYTLVATLLN